MRFHTKTHAPFDAAQFLARAAGEVAPSKSVRVYLAQPLTAKSLKSRVR